MEKGILIIGHGSRSKDASVIFDSIVEQFKSRGYKNVIGANMELAKPDIHAAVEKFLEKGITDIIALPLFLYIGIHIKEDIPEILADFKEKYPELKFKLAEPLKDDSLIVDVLAKRYQEALN